MLKSPLLIGMIGLLVVQPCLAGPSESELLDKYNDDPSLLLDPSTYVEAPSENREPANAPESPAPVEEAPVQIVEPAPVMPPVAEIENKASESPVAEKPVAEEKSPAEEKDKKVAETSPGPEMEKEIKVSEAPVAPSASPAPPALEAPVVVSEVAGPPEPPAIKAPEEPKQAPIKSELVALPGVTDFSIILSGEQFFPSVIRMKQNGNKNRLLFVTTGTKPAALVFVKPRIQRWISSQSDNRSVEEYREVSGSKVTEIEFDAAPGIYEYYDALSGARGEIKVE